MSDDRPPSGYAIQRAVSAAHDAIKTAIAEPDSDLQELLDALPAADDPRAVLRRLCLAALEAEAWDEAAAVRGRQLAARRQRFQRNSEALRNAARMVIELLPEVFRNSRYKDESLTVTVSDGPAGVVVTDAEKLERRFLRIPPPEPDKVLIGRALKDGEVVDGATLSNPQPVLRIKAT
jgi:hypothetical protein